MSRLTFYGGAGTVTGVNILVESDSNVRVLLDCGLLQRERSSDTVNASRFEYDVRSVDALLISHAHADHIGRVPKLMREGFSGKIHSTAPTKELAALMFDDALHIMEEEAETHGTPPLYGREDAAAALERWETHGYHEPFSLKDVEVQFLNAGHVLGSAMIRLTRDGKTLLFTGDLGNAPEPLLPDADSPAGADYLIMESVYGDRLHEDKEKRTELLRSIVEGARRRGGTLLIPSFSIERTQILLYELRTLFAKGELQSVPVFLDAPLASRVTEVYRTHSEYLKERLSDLFADGEDPFTFPGLTVTSSRAESEKIHKHADPKIIIAGSGMSHGGRIREHERRYLERKDTTLLFVGYQAPGSLGRRIEEGARTVFIDGKRVRIRAHIEAISGYSGHADRDALLSFVEEAAHSIKKVFVAMGEPHSSLFLSQRIHDFLGLEAVVPLARETCEIAW